MCAYSALGVDVRDVCCHTRASHDVVQGQLADSRVELQEEGKWLANATCGAEDSNLGCLQHVLRQPMFSSVLNEVRLYSPTLAAVAEKLLRCAALKTDRET